jgi:hypothetical protein
LKGIQELFDDLISLIEFSADSRFPQRKEIKKSVKFGFKVYKTVWFMASTNCINAAFAPIISHKLPSTIWLPFEDTEIGFWITSYWTVFQSFFRFSSFQPGFL